MPAADHIGPRPSGIRSPNFVLRHSRFRSVPAGTRPQPDHSVRQVARRRGRRSPALLLRAEASRRHHDGCHHQRQVAASHLNAGSASQGFTRVLSVGRRIRLSLVRFFEDLTARKHDSAGRLGPQPFRSEVAPRSRRTGAKCGHAAAWSGGAYSNACFPNGPPPSAASRRTISGGPGSRASLSGSCAGASCLRMGTSRSAGGTSSKRQVETVPPGEECLKSTPFAVVRRRSQHCRPMRYLTVFSMSRGGGRRNRANAW